MSKAKKFILPWGHSGSCNMTLDSPYGLFLLEARATQPSNNNKDKNKEAPSIEMQIFPLR